MLDPPRADGRQTATRIEEVLKEFGGPLLRLPCGDPKLRNPNSASTVVLTTPEKLKRCPQLLAEPWKVSSNLGVGVYLYARKDTDFGKIRDLTIGLLRSDNRFKDDLRDALQTLARPGQIVDVKTAVDYGRLIAGLLARNPVYAAIGVISDGTRQPLETLRNALGKLPPETIERVDLHRGYGPVAQATPGPTAMATPAALAWLVDPNEVDPLASDQDRRAVLALPIDDATGGGPPLPKEAGGLRTVQAGERPMVTSVPILVTRGRVPPDVVVALHEALLVALIDGELSACRLAHKDMYRSFLLAAIGMFPGASADRLALWEHSTLLATILKDNALLTADLNPAEKNLVKTFVGKPDEADRKACGVDRRDDFSGRAEPKVVYFEESLKHLRKALTKTMIKGSTEGKKASACLRLALWEAGEDFVPSCLEFRQGMWKDHYVPFLPLAVLKE